MAVMAHLRHEACDAFERFPAGMGRGCLRGSIGAHDSRRRPVHEQAHAPRRRPMTTIDWSYHRNG